MCNTARHPLPVTRSKQQAKDFYNRLASIYDWLEDWWERKPRAVGMRMLRLRPGERVLEIGQGTGRGLEVIAQQIGPEGRAYGLDLADGMLRATRYRLARSGLLPHVGLVQGDGADLPFGSNVFDAVFISFVLDLFDTPEIPEVLGECRRVLKHDGRLGVVSTVLPDQPGKLIQLYEWGHKRFPTILDCRPIPVQRLLEESGLQDIAA